MSSFILVIGITPLAAGTHGGHHFSPDSDIDCDENFCAEGSGTLALAAPVTCGTPPNSNMVCLDISGSFGGYSELLATTTQQQSNPEPSNPELKGGSAEGHLAHMDPDTCSWPATPGSCSKSFMDGISPVHKAWHYMDGTQYIHVGWSNVYPDWECNTSLPGCPGNSHASFSPWYRYY